MNDLWYKAKAYSNEIKKKYIDIVLKEKYDSGDFYLIYSDLQSTAFEKKMSLQIDQALEELKSKSLIKFQKQNKSKQKKKGK